MSEQEKIALSKRVAELYRIGERTPMLSINLLLYEDSARCFELVVEHELSIEFIGDTVFVGSFSFDDVFENYEDHISKAEATRVAILKFLVKMKES